jgi:hypothetical protein
MDANPGSAYVLNATDHTLKDTMVFGQRAYVGINVLAALRMDTQKASFTFENFGQTPAKDVKVFSNWEFVEAGGNVPKDFAFPEKTGSNDTSLVPGGTTVFPRNPVPGFANHCPGDYQKLLLVEKTNCAGSITDTSHIETCSTNPAEPIFASSTRPAAALFVTATTKWTPTKITNTAHAARIRTALHLGSDRALSPVAFAP